MSEVVRVDVTDHNSLDRWFRNRSYQEAIILLSRNAMRLFPLVSIYYEGTEPSGHLNVNQLVLYILRSLLFEAVAAEYTNQTSTETLQDWHARTENFSNFMIEDNEVSSSTIDLVSALLEPMLVAATSPSGGASFTKMDSSAQSLAIQSIASGTNYYAGYEGPNLSLLESYIGAATAIDAGAADNAKDPRKVFNRKLWHQSTVPKDISDAYNDLQVLYGFNRSEWSFWRRWYQGFLDGKPLEWELQRQVALIDDTVWGAGPADVAAEIERIKARRALEAEIAALKEQLKQTQVAEPADNRLHNNPPEAIESQQQLKSEITLIWELLEDTEREIAKPSPSPSALRVIADTLWEISLRIGKYCASLADVALKKSAEVIGETGTKAGIAVFVTTTAAQNEGVKAVVHAIWEFVKTLPAG